MTNTNFKNFQFEPMLVDVYFLKQTGRDPVIAKLFPWNILELFVVVKGKNRLRKIGHRKFGSILAKCFLIEILKLFRDPDILLRAATKHSLNISKV